MSQALATYNKDHILLCQATAIKQQKANLSDPFTFDRVMTHLLCGLCIMSDYAVEFRKEARIVVNSLTTAQGKTYSVEVPHNMKRP